LNESNCTGRILPQNVLYLLQFLFSPITFPVSEGLILRNARLLINNLIDLGRKQLREAYMESFGRVMGGVGLTVLAADAS